MIDTTKVRLMTKTAVYENGIGKEDIRINRWKESTYIGFKVLESILYITITYLIGACVYASRYFSAIIKEGFGVFKTPAMHLFMIYLAVILVCWFLSHRFYKKKYRDARRRIVQYDKDLGAIEAYINTRNE